MSKIKNTYGKSIVPNDIIVNPGKENFKNENIISFQLIQKVELPFLTSFYYNSHEDLVKIHELSNKAFGILFENKLVIFSTKIFKKIKIIEPKNEEKYSLGNFYSYNNKFIDFLELKNSNIVLWTSNIILIYDKDYNLIQKIDEYEPGNKSKREDYDYGTHEYYEINSIYELKNGKLISCNSYGLKFYEKDNNRYNLILTEKIEIDVDYVVEIKPNILILLQKHYDEKYSDMEGEDQYLISIYNIENKTISRRFYFKNESIMGEFKKVNFITNKKYLIMRHGETTDIFNLENNNIIELAEIKNENDVSEYTNRHCCEKIMKEEKRIIELYATYSDNFFIGKFIINI